MEAYTAEYFSFGEYRFGTEGCGTWDIDIGDGLTASFGGLGHTAEGRKLMKAKADFITTACNSHDDLLAACKATIGFCVNLRQNGDWENHPDAGVLFALTAAAIDKATN